MTVRSKVFPVRIFHLVECNHGNRMHNNHVHIEKLEDVFIPSFTFAEDAESHISVKESDADDSDFAASVQALRNLRRKK